MKDLLTKLKEPFPKEAHSTDSSRGFDLTSVKAQWVVERLNDVFGVFGWGFTPTYTTIDNYVLCQGELRLTNKENIRVVRQSGGAVIRKNLADAYKSASTDSLGKCASWLCIGNDVFKGNVDPKTFEIKLVVTETIKKLSAEAMSLFRMVSQEKNTQLKKEYGIDSQNSLYQMNAAQLEGLISTLKLAKISEGIKE